jgi:hypothetical protein
MPKLDNERQMAGSAEQQTELQPDRTAELEALLREAIVWAPRLPSYPPTGKHQADGRGWVDLGNRIEAALKGTP